MLALLFFIQGVVTLVGQAEQLAGPEPGTLQRPADAVLWRSIAEADVIYIGETHDRPADHAYQLRLVRGMVRRQMDFAVGWEMFDQTQQGSLDAWDRGLISRQQLFQATGFDRRWAVYSPFYAKVLQTVKRARQENVALNAPPNLVKKIARGQNVSSQEKALLPHGFTTNRAAYRNFVALMGGHPGIPAHSVRSLFAAQNVWDQTMADRILQFHRLRPQTKLVVLTGRGHVAGGFGIPFFVKQKGSLRQLIVLP